MTRREQNAKMEEAVALLEEVAGVQDGRKRWCEECGGAEYEDFSSHQLKEGLRGVVRRLKKLMWHDEEGFGSPETLAPGRRGR